MGITINRLGYTLDTLLDTSITGITLNDVIKYDGTNWVNSNSITISGITMAAFANDLIHGNSTGAFEGISDVATGRTLISQGVSTIPAWSIDLPLAGYIRVGSASAPTNTTAGDLTCVRFNVGNSSFANNAAMSSSITNTVITSSTNNIANWIHIFNPSGINSAVSHYGTYYDTRLNGSFDNGVACGVLTVMRYGSSGGSTGLFGLQAEGFYGSTSTAFGTVTLSVAGQFRAIDHFTNNPTGTITAAHGVRVLNNNAGGSNITVTGTVGVSIAQQTLGTNNTNLLLGTTTIPTGTWSMYNSSTFGNYMASGLAIGTTSIVAPLTIGGTWAHNILLHVAPVSVGSSTSQLTGFNLAPAFTPAGATIATVIGATTIPVLFNTSKNITTYYGHSYRLDGNAYSGAVTTAITLAINNPSFLSGSGTIGALYGLYVSDLVSGMNNNIGASLNVSSGSGKYNIYAGGTAQNYFAGNVGIGIAVADALLTVGDSATTTAALINVYGDNTGATANSLGTIKLFGQSDQSIKFRAPGDGQDGLVESQYGLTLTYGVSASNSLTIKKNTTSVVTINSLGYVGIGVTSPTYTIHTTGSGLFNMDNLVLVQTDAIVLANETAATGAVSGQYSPQIRFRGSSYISSTNNTIDFAIGQQASGGAPGSYLSYFVLSARTNMGAYTNLLSINSGGSTVFTGVVTAGGFTTVGTTTTGILINTSDGITAISTTGSTLLQNTTLSTVGTQNQYTPAIQFVGHVWNTSAGADRYHAWTIQAVPTSGAIPSTKLGFYSYTGVSAPSTPTIRMSIDDSGDFTATHYISATGYKVSASATSGTILRGNGTIYTSSTATFADTYASGVVLWASTANTVAGMVPTISGVMVSDAFANPSFQTSPVLPPITIGADGTQIKKIYSASATLDFGSTASHSQTDLTITVTGAAANDPVALSVPSGAYGVQGVYSAFVSSANTVTVRYSNYTAGSLDPGSGTFRVVVFRF